MFDDYMLDKVLVKIKEIVGIEKFDDTKILIDADDKLSYITFENVVILMTYVIKDYGKFYPQIISKEALFNKELSEELMFVVRHPLRWWDRCLPEDEKKEIELIFTGECC